MGRRRVEKEGIGFRELGVLPWRGLIGFRVHYPYFCGKMSCCCFVGFYVSWTELVAHLKAHGDSLQLELEVE